MDKAKIDEIRQWVRKAQNDLGSAKRLSSGQEVFPDTAVYHCQQAAEKVLKAYLTLTDVPFAKIHDLSALVDECLKSDKAFEQLRDAAEVLTPYGTAFRYPGEVLEPEASDVQEAITLAESVVNFIIQKIPDEAKTV